MWNGSNKPGFHLSAFPWILPCLVKLIFPHVLSFCACSCYGFHGRVLTWSIVSKISCPSGSSYIVHVYHGAPILFICCCGSHCKEQGTSNRWIDNRMILYTRTSSSPVTRPNLTSQLVSEYQESLRPPQYALLMIWIVIWMLSEWGRSANSEYHCSSRRHDTRGYVSVRLRQPFIWHCSIGLFPGHASFREKAGQVFSFHDFPNYKKTISEWSMSQMCNSLVSGLLHSFSKAFGKHS